MTRDDKTSDLYEDGLYVGPGSAPTSPEVIEAEERQYAADAVLASEYFRSGKLKAFAGRYVAFYGGRFAGADEDPNALRVRVAKENGIFISQVVIEYADPQFVS